MINNEYFLLDQKDWVLDKKSVEYLPFWAEQKQRCIEGVTIGGVWIPGRLYFYINFGTIEVDMGVGSSSFKRPGRPYFRDVDWEIINKFEEAERTKKGLILLTGRGLGKSFIAASIVAHMYSFVSNSESIVSSEDTKYIHPLMQKIDLCLRYLPLQFQKRRTQDDLKTAIRAGWKDNKTGLRKGSDSRILVRNYKNDPMAANGTRPKVHILEEIGTMRHLKEDYNSSVPCWVTDSGQTGTPFLIGTGGSFEEGKDAVEMFNEPEQYNLLSITDIWETGKQIGMFIPATRAKNIAKDSKGKIFEMKSAQPMSSFLNFGIGNYCLDNSTILVSDEEIGREYFNAIRDIKKKSSDPMNFIQEVMYNPFVPSEVLIRTSANRFNTDLLQAQLYLLDTQFKDIGMPVSMYINLISGKVEARATDKKPIREFPIRPEHSKEGCVVIYEHPIDNPPYGLYIAGIDPYDQDQASNSPSIGSCFIYKRFSGLKETNDRGEAVVDSKDSVLASRQIVAEYSGRPNMADTFYENCRLLLLYYNARALVENENTRIITYFYNKRCDYLLADTPKRIMNILGGEPVKGRTKGLHADPTGKYAAYGINLLKDYVNEELFKEFNDKGELVRTVQGATRLKCPALIKEMLAYDPEDAKGNYDRIVAMYFTLLYEEEMHVDAVVQSQEDSDPIAYFANTKGIYTKPKREVW